MRVLLVNPSRAGKGNIPVNLPVLCAALKRGGHEVRLFDFSDYLCYQTTTQDGGTGQGTSSQLATEELDYSKLFFKDAEEVDSAVVWQDRKRFYHEYGSKWVSPENDHLLRITDPQKDFDDICEEWKPDLVGVSCLTVDFPSAIRFLAAPKKKYGFHLLFGGVHAITLPDHAIHSEFVDSICIGEGEEAILQLLDGLKTGKEYWLTPNMWVKYEGKLYKNPNVRMTNMADLPYMDFDCFDPLHFHRPFDGKLYRMLNYEWGRGCPYKCTYCENVVLNELYKDIRDSKKVVRHKTPEQSMDELDFLIKKYGFNFIRFWDEDFTAVNPKEMREYAEHYKKRIGLPFLVYSRTESLSEEKCKILADMGCVTFAMGIESGSEFVRRQVLDRPLANRQILDKFQLAKKYGIRVSGYNIIGLPMESRQEIFETIKLNRVAPIASSSCTLLEPYPATPIRSLCEDEGLPKTHYPNYDSFNGIAQFIPKGIDREELEGLFKTFSLYVHLPRFMFPLIKLAEEDSPAGKAVFKTLMQIKITHFMEKPTYAEEDDYKDMMVGRGLIEVVEGVDYADDIAKANEKHNARETASGKVREIKKPPPIPDRVESAQALLGVLGKNEKCA